MDLEEEHEDAEQMGHVPRQPEYIHGSEQGAAVETEVETRLAGKRKRRRFAGGRSERDSRIEDWSASTGIGSGEKEQAKKVGMWAR